MEDFSLRIMITLCIYFILTLPFLSLIFFGYGIEYNTFECVMASFFAVIGAPIIHKNYFNK